MKTVTIKPAVAFVNGTKMTAEAINVVSVSDNLFDHVIFKYTLLTATGEWAGEASFELKGRETYQTWDASAEGAYKIVGDGIGVEFAQSKSDNFFEG